MVHKPIALMILPIFVAGILTLGILAATANAQESNNTGNTTQQNADFVNSILAVHNRERAEVGVPPLVWSDKLAADAKPWAEHLATTPEFGHNGPELKALGEGENIAGFQLDVGPSAPGNGQSLWVDEKKNYHGGPISMADFSNGAPPIGHYTQMVWRTTTQVGCATATGGGHPFSILVCRYSPAGNTLGQKPF